MHHGFVFGRVFVGLEQNAVELLGNRLGAAALHQRLCPSIDLGLNGFFLFNRSQGLLQHLSGGFFVAAFACFAKVVGGLRQRQQGSQLLLQQRRVLKIHPRQLGKAKLVFGGKLPRQIKVELGQQGRAFGQQLAGLRLVKAHQHVGQLDLHALARLQLHLRRTVGFGHHTASQQLARLIKQNKQNSLSGVFTPQFRQTAWPSPDCSIPECKAPRPWRWGVGGQKCLLWLKPLAGWGPQPCA